MGFLWYGIPMFEVELLSALLIWPGATPATGALTRVLADKLAPPTPGGYRLRCWAPPANASLEGATPRLDMRCDYCRCPRVLTTHVFFGAQ